jgi:hypothetical protein
VCGPAPPKGQGCRRCESNLIRIATHHSILACPYPTIPVSCHPRLRIRYLRHLPNRSRTRRSRTACRSLPDGLGTTRSDEQGSYRGYRDLDEFTALQHLLINVTSFFRAAEAWHYLRAEVLEPLVLASRATR